MARQLAALPKKQFEMYRSKKLLSTDHSFLSPGSSQVIKDRLNSDIINKSFMSNVEKDLIILQDHVDNLGSLELASSASDAKPKEENKKKRVRSKKRKSTNSTTSDREKPNMDSISDSTGKKGDNFVKDGKRHQVTSVIDKTGRKGSIDGKESHNVFGSGDTPIDVNTDSNFGDEFSVRETCGSSSSNDSGVVTPKELFFGDEAKEVDSGLGSHSSPVFARGPPFGFPPSSQSLLESALVLLPSVGIEKDKTSQPFENSKNISKKSRVSGGNQRHNEDSKSLAKRKGSLGSPRGVEDYRSSDFSDMKENCKDCTCIEGESVDGDISSSSAIEDDKGWQSQTRSHRRKKKEYVARFNRERNNSGQFKFQREVFDKQQSDNQSRKNFNQRRSFDGNKNQVFNTPGKGFKDTEIKMNNITAGATKVNEHYKENNNQTGNTLNSSKQAVVPEDSKKGSSVQRVMSYRDALLKGKPKEPTESSDSGVEVLSVSSFDVRSSKDSFNKQQCVDYLRNAWKKVLSDARKGLVIYLNVDSVD